MTGQTLTRAGTSNVAAGPKTALILLAHHHCSGNIASQRFVGLLKYLPRERHTVHAISGPSVNQSVVAASPEVTSIEAPLLIQASWSSRLEVLLRMALPRLRSTQRFKHYSWIAQAVEEGRKQVRSERQLGHRVIVMATYSPIDALIAARLIANAERVPLIQDFRDGFVHEGLGRKGSVFSFLRKHLEAWSVGPATMISTVSRPLVEYFKKYNCDKQVVLLYNGFDITQLSLPIEVNRPVPLQLDSKPINIGHFGRISASEAARLTTLQMLIKLLEAGPFSGQLEFYGELTQTEILLLSETNVDSVRHGQVSRDVALSKMERMTALLIVTGNSASVATGKIFEYLFSGRRILLVTQCNNEATRILKEVGDDDIVINFSEPSTIPSLEDLEARLSRPFVRSLDRIARFSKATQAEQFSEMLTQIAGVGEIALSDKRRKW